MKIYARQTAPECQDASVYFDFEAEDIVVFGNDRLNGINRQIVRDAQHVYDNITYEGYAFYTKDGKLISDEQIKMLFDSSVDKPFTNFLTDYLTVYFGKEYEMRTIRGCVQGDWNIAYAPKGYDFRELEVAYFNLGVELEIEVTDREITDPDQIEGSFDYFIGDDLKNEIKERYGDYEIVLWEFDGWKRTPKYKLA